MEKEAAAAQVLGRFVWRRSVRGGEPEEEEGAG
jgi:hypothetical protein